MATNIEQIFRSFVVNKFKEIQEEGKLNSENSESSQNGEVTEKPENPSEASAVCPQSEGSSEIKEDETMKPELQNPVISALETDGASKEMKSADLTSDDEGKRDSSKKKSKKHKKHKSKKKKKKKKKEKHEKRSKSVSSVEDQENINTEVKSVWKPAFTSPPQEQEKIDALSSKPESLNVECSNVAELPSVSIQEENIQSTKDQPNLLQFDVDSGFFGPKCPNEVTRNVPTNILTVSNAGEQCDVSAGIALHSSLPSRNAEQNLEPAKTQDGELPLVKPVQVSNIEEIGHSQDVHMKIDCLPINKASMSPSPSKPEVETIIQKSKAKSRSRTKSSSRHRSRSKSLNKLPKSFQRSSKSPKYKQRSRSNSRNQRKRSRSGSGQRRRSRSKSPVRRRRSRSRTPQYSKSPIRSWWSKSIRNRQRSVSVVRRRRSRTKSPGKRRRSRSAEKRYHSRTRSRSRNRQQKSRLSKSASTRRTRSKSARRRSRSGSLVRGRKSRSISLVKTRRSRSVSPARRRRSRSTSPLRRRRSKSISPLRRRRSRSTTPARRRKSRSASLARRRRRSRSASAARRRRRLSRSASPARRRRLSRSASPARRRRLSRSASPARRRRSSRSASPARRRRSSRSASPARRRRSSRSASPARRRRLSRSASPARRRRLSRSASPPRRGRSSRSASLARRGRSSRSVSPARRRSLSVKQTSVERSSSSSAVKKQRSPSSSAKISTSATRMAPSMSISASQNRQSRSPPTKQTSQSEIENVLQTGSDFAQKLAFSESKPVNVGGLNLKRSNEDELSSFSTVVEDNTNNEIQVSVLASELGDESEKVCPEKMQSEKLPPNTDIAETDSLTDSLTASFVDDLLDSSLKTPVLNKPPACTFSEPSSPHPKPVSNTSSQMLASPNTSVELYKTAEHFSVNPAQTCVDMPPKSGTFSEDGSALEVITDNIAQPFLEVVIDRETPCDNHNELDLVTMKCEPDICKSEVGSERASVLKMEDTRSQDVSDLHKLSTSDLHQKSDETLHQDNTLKTSVNAEGNLDCLTQNSLLTADLSSEHRTVQSSNPKHCGFNKYLSSENKKNESFSPSTYSHLKEPAEYLNSITPQATTDLHKNENAELDPKHVPLDCSEPGTQFIPNAEEKMDLAFINSITSSEQPLKNQAKTLKNTLLEQAFSESDSYRDTFTNSLLVHKESTPIFNLSNTNDVGLYQNCQTAFEPSLHAKHLSEQATFMRKSIVLDHTTKDHSANIAVENIPETREPTNQTDQSESSISVLSEAMQAKESPILQKSRIHNESLNDTLSKGHRVLQDSRFAPDQDSSGNAPSPINVISSKKNVECKLTDSKVLHCKKQRFSDLFETNETEQSCLSTASKTPEDAISTNVKEANICAGSILSTEFFKSENKAQTSEVVPQSMLPTENKEMCPEKSMEFHPVDSITQKDELLSCKLEPCGTAVGQREARAVHEQCLVLSSEKILDQNPPLPTQKFELHKSLFLSDESQVVTEMLPQEHANLQTIARDSTQRMLIGLCSAQIGIGSKADATAYSTKNIELDRSHKVNLEAGADGYPESGKKMSKESSMSDTQSVKKSFQPPETQSGANSVIYEMPKPKLIAPLQFKFSKTFKTLPSSQICNTSDESSDKESSRVSSLTQSTALSSAEASSPLHQKQLGASLPSKPLETVISSNLEQNDKEIMQPDKIQVDDSQSSEQSVTVKHAFPHHATALSKLGVKQRQYRSRSNAQDSRSPSLDRRRTSRSRSKSATRKRRSRSKSKKRSQSSSRKKSSHSKSDKRKQSRSKSRGRKRRSKSKSKKKHSPSKSAGKRKRSRSKSSERKKSVGRHRDSRSKSKTRRKQAHSKSPVVVRKGSHSKARDGKNASRSKSLSSRSRSRSVSASRKRQYSKTTSRRKPSRSSSKSTSPRKRSLPRNKGHSRSKSPARRRRSWSRSRRRPRSRSRGRWHRSRSKSSRRRSRSSSLFTKRRGSLSKSPVRRRRSRSQGKQKDKSPVAKRKSVSPPPVKKTTQSKAAGFKPIIGLKSLIQKQLSKATSQGTGAQSSSKEHLPLATIAARAQLAAANFTARAQLSAPNLTNVDHLPVPNLAEVPLPIEPVSVHVPTPSLPSDQLSVTSISGEASLPVPDLTSATQWHVSDMSSGAQWPVPDIAAGAQWSMSDLAAGPQWPMADLTAGSHWPMHDMTVGTQWPVPDLAAGTQWTVPDVATGAQWTVPDLTASTQWTVPDITAGSQWAMTNMAPGAQWALPDLAAAAQWAVPDLTSGTHIQSADLVLEAQVPGSDLATEAQVPGSDLATEAQVPGSDLAAEAQVPGSDLVSEARVPVPDHIPDTCGNEHHSEGHNLMPDVAAEALVPVASATLVPDVAAGIPLPDVTAAAQSPVPDVAASAPMLVPDVATAAQGLMSSYASAAVLGSVFEDASKESVYSDLPSARSEPSCVIDSLVSTEHVRSKGIGSLNEEADTESSPFKDHTLLSELTSENATVPEISSGFSEDETLLVSKCPLLSEPCRSDTPPLSDLCQEQVNLDVTIQRESNTSPNSQVATPDASSSGNITDLNEPCRLPVEPDASLNEDTALVEPYQSPDHNLLIEPYSSPDRSILVSACSDSDHPLLTEPVSVLINPSTSGDHAVAESSPGLVQSNQQLIHIYDCPDSAQLNEYRADQSCPDPAESYTSPKPQVQPYGSPNSQTSEKPDSGPNIPQLVEPYASPEPPQLVEPYSSPEHAQLVEPYNSPACPLLVEPYGSPLQPQLVEQYGSPESQEQAELCVSPETSHVFQPNFIPDHGDPHDATELPQFDQQHPTQELPLSQENVSLEFHEPVQPSLSPNLQIKSPNCSDNRPVAYSFTDLEDSQLVQKYDCTEDLQLDKNCAIPEHDQLQPSVTPPPPQLVECYVSPEPTQLVEPYTSPGHTQDDLFNANPEVLVNNSSCPADASESPEQMSSVLISRFEDPLLGQNDTKKSEPLQEECPSSLVQKHSPGNSPKHNLTVLEECNDLSDQSTFRVVSGGDRYTVQESSCESPKHLDSKGEYEICAQYLIGHCYNSEAPLLGSSDGNQKSFSCSLAHCEKDRIVEKEVSSVEDHANHSRPQHTSPEDIHSHSSVLQLGEYSSADHVTEPIHLSDQTSETQSFSSTSHLLRDTYLGLPIVEDAIGTPSSPHSVSENSSIALHERSTPSPDVSSPKISVCAVDTALEILAVQQEDPSNISNILNMEAISNKTDQCQTDKATSSLESDSPNRLPTLDEATSKKPFSDVENMAQQQECLLNNDDHQLNKTYSSPIQPIADHTFYSVELKPCTDSKSMLASAMHSQNRLLDQPKMNVSPDSVCNTTKERSSNTSNTETPVQIYNESTLAVSEEIVQQAADLPLICHEELERCKYVKDSLSVESEVSVVDNVGEHLQINQYKIAPPDLLPFDSDQPTQTCANSELSEPVLFNFQPPPELLPYDSEQPTDSFCGMSELSSGQDSSDFHKPPELLPYDSDQTTVVLKLRAEYDGNSITTNTTSVQSDQSSVLSLNEDATVNRDLYLETALDSMPSEGKGLDKHMSLFEDEDIAEYRNSTSETNDISIRFTDTSISNDASMPIPESTEDQSSVSEMLDIKPVSILPVAECLQELPPLESVSDKTIHILEPPVLIDAPPLSQTAHSIEDILVSETLIVSQSSNLASEDKIDKTLKSDLSSCTVQPCSGNASFINVSEVEKSSMLQSCIASEATIMQSPASSSSKIEASLIQPVTLKQACSQPHSRTSQSPSQSKERKRSRSKSTTRKKTRSKSPIKKSRSRSPAQRKRSRSGSRNKRSRSRKRRSRTPSVPRKRSSRSKSATRRRRSPSRRKRSRSTSVDHKSSHSRSVARRRRSRTRSPVRWRRSRTRSPVRRRRSRSSSVRYRRRSRSSSVSRRRRSRSLSAIRRRRSRSSSLTQRRRSPSQSISRWRQSSSLNRRRRSRSPSPGHRRRSRSASRRKRSRSISISRKRRSPSAHRKRRSRSSSATHRKRSPSAAPKRRSRSTSATRKKRSRSSSIVRKRRSRSLSTRKRRSRTPSVLCKRKSQSKSPTPKSPKNKSRAHSKSDRSRSRSQSNITRKRKTRSRSSSKDKNKSNDKRCKRSNSKEHYSVKQRRKSRTPPRRKKSRSPVRRVSPCRSPVRRRRSRSPVRRKSFSRSPVRRKRSRSRDQSLDSARSPKRLTDLDKAQLLEIAKANAAAMCAKAGVPLPPSLKPVISPAIPIDDKVPHRNYGVTIQELTEKCKLIAQSKEDDEVVNKPHNSDDDEEDKPFYNHPFKVGEHKPISFSLMNPNLKPAVKTQVTLTKEFPVSSGSQHRKKEDKVYGEWVPVDKKSEESKDDVFTNSGPSQPVDITAAMNERAIAQTRLTGNPFDLEALFLLNRSQEQIDAWAQSSSIPGQFTGSTGAQVLSADEISNSGPQAWLKKDQFLRAAPVSGGRGALLMRKMGWKEGEGLGRNNEGNVDPIVLDFKTDRKGLVADGEKASNKLTLPAMKDLSGKHPISALMELCNKKKWSPPDFLLVDDTGPDHRKRFLFKVTVNGVICQPSQASVTKKLAKATAAAAALQALGALPKDTMTSTSNFCTASSANTP